MEYSRDSEGAFDISVGPLMKVWGFYKGSGHLPHQPEIAAALAKVGYRHIHLDPAAQTVRFDRAGCGAGPGRDRQRLCGGPDGGGSETERDPDGPGGGFGQQYLRDGRAAGRAKGLAGEDPGSEGQPKTVAEVYLKDNSMSTSGNYEKFFRAEGKIYSHIMDPRTGYPAQGMFRFR